MSKLTPKATLFVQEYLKDLNAKQAAIRAGYSVRTAEVAGCRLLSNVKVAGEISKAKIARSERVKIDSDKVLAHLTEILEADIIDIINDDNTFRPVSEWPKICCLASM